MKLLAWRAKKQKGQNLVQALKDKDGNIFSSSKDNMNMMVSFYKNLYSSTNPTEVDIENFLFLSQLFAKLTPDHILFMDSPISEEEIKQMIKFIKPNKAPGPDGFPIEFYKKFPPLIELILEKTFIHILQTGTLPGSWKDATLITIFKLDKDPCLPSSYCPIALLNQDYKILTGIMASRLNKNCPYYVDTDQSGFITLKIDHRCQKGVKCSTLLQKTKIGIGLTCLRFQEGL